MLTTTSRETADVCSGLMLNSASVLLVPTALASAPGGRGGGPLTVGRDVLSNYVEDTANFTVVTEQSLQQH